MTTTLLPLLLATLAPVLTLALATSPSCGPCTCDLDPSGEITANCSDLGLTSIPHSLPANTSRLLMAGNPLSHLADDGALSRLPRLTHLDLSRCSLTNVANTSLSGLSRLRWLDLALNPGLCLQGVTSAVRGLPRDSSLQVLNASRVVPALTLGVTVTVELAEALQPLPLQELVLDGNQIEVVCDGVLERLPAALKTLSVRSNRLRPGLYMFSLQQLGNLTHLSAENQFCSDEATLSLDPGSLWAAAAAAAGVAGRTPPVLPRAQPGDQGGSPGSSPADPELTEVPTHSEQLPRGPEADSVAESGCAVFQAAASSSSSSSSSSSTAAPAPKCRTAETVRRTLELLEQVHSGNFVLHLPPSLVLLNLSRNHLDFPLGNVNVLAPALKVLDLTSNRFSDLLGPVSGLESLERLDLSNNHALNLGPDFFSRTTGLRQLSLQGNHLGLQRALDSGARFSQLASLEYLDLGGNYVNQMAADLFQGLTNVSTLNLPFNVIARWDPDISGMAKLRYLDIHLNSLTSIPRRLRVQLDAIAGGAPHRNFTLALQKNSYRCSCTTRGSWQWLRKFNSSHSVRLPFPDRVTCKGPGGDTWRLGNAADLQRALDHLASGCRDLSTVIGVVVTIVVFVVFFAFVALLVYLRHRLSRCLQQGEDDDTGDEEQRRRLLPPSGSDDMDTGSDSPGEAYRAAASRGHVQNAEA